jgi:hypothetical protein
LLGSGKLDGAARGLKKKESRSSDQLANRVAGGFAGEWGRCGRPLCIVLGGQGTRCPLTTVADADVEWGFEVNSNDLTSTGQRPEVSTFVRAAR